MTDKPILMSPAMALATWEGNKTQTRRVIHKRNALDAIAVFGASFLKLAGCVDMLPVRARVGDLLWVREPWRSDSQMDSIAPSKLHKYEPRFFIGGRWVIEPACTMIAPGKYRQAMHMPRVFSRMTLKVTDVRVELLQKISEVDAIAEGISPLECYGPDCPVGDNGCNAKGCFGVREGFQTLWDSLNEQRGFGWDTNPWVAAYTFEVIKQNIDEVGR